MRATFGDAEPKASDREEGRLLSEPSPAVQWTAGPASSAPALSETVGEGSPKGRLREPRRAPFDRALKTPNPFSARSITTLQ